MARKRITKDTVIWMQGNGGHGYGFFLDKNNPEVVFFYMEYSKTNRIIKAQEINAKFGFVVTKLNY